MRQILTLQPCFPRARAREALRNSSRKPSRSEDGTSRVNEADTELAVSSSADHGLPWRVSGTVRAHANKERTKRNCIIEPRANPEGGGLGSADQ